MTRNRTLIVLLAILTVLAMASAALAAPPPGKGKPDKPEPPAMWTCEERVKNGAVWIPGHWNGTSYVSDYPVPQFDVDIPLCIDIKDEHRTLENWTVTWKDGTARKDPKGLMFIFEEEVHAAHYAELEVSMADYDIATGTVPMTLDFSEDDDGNVEHLVFVAMGRQGDKWTNLAFTVTPYPPTP